MDKKIVEINIDEIEELVDICDDSRKLLNAFRNVLAVIDERIAKARRWLAVMELRVACAEEVEDED